MEKYQDIRPLTDAEARPTLLKYTDNPAIFKLIKYIYPSWKQADTNEKIASIDSIKKFHEILVYPGLQACISKSTSSFTHSGLEHLDPNTPYLFITNHRDIVLDSSLLFYILQQEGYLTGQSAIGDNLIISDLVRDIVRLNQSFLVHRNLNARESIIRLKTLSSYMHQVLFEQKKSIWISQREGRTKDGNDQTYPGILKMIALCQEDKIDYLLNCKIVPVSISYEYDSCDQLKAKETLQQELSGGNYKKEAMEDMNSIIYGITQQKGAVHFAFGEEITAENTTLHSSTLPEQYKELCQHIDHQIHKNTKLTATHYIAHDLLHNSHTYAAHYTSSQKQGFTSYLNTILSVHQNAFDSQAYKQHFLSIYANTLHNTLQAQNKMDTP